MKPKCRSLSLLIIGVAIAGGETGAAEKKITIKDYTGRGFPPDLVNYSLKAGKSASSKLRLFDAQEKAMPLQVVAADGDGLVTLSFVTQIAANATATFSLRDGGGKAAPKGGVQIVRSGKNLELSNGLLSVRLPGEAKQKLKKAVAASTLPAPILAFRNGDGAWLGAGLQTEAKLVEKFRVKLVASGPVYAELLYEIEWADGGYYRARIQVIDQVPLVMVREEYDLGKLDGSQFWELDLSSGWKPDRAQTASHNGNGGGDPTGREVDFAGLMRGQPVQYMVGDQAWGKLSHLGIFNQSESKTSPNAFPLVGVVPLRKGLWRRSNALEVLSSGANNMRVRFPMSARHAEWGRDITSETSPFSTQEHEMSLPKTYGRRVWGLALGLPSIPDPQGNRPFYQLQRIYGIVGLDRYKDFILEWPDAMPTYPRLYGSRTNTSPEGSINSLRNSCQYYFNSTHSSHHGTSGNYMIAARADADLAKPDLLAEMRREIRARLALHCYLYADADMMSYGNGHHHGNPNMGTARFWSGPCFVALLPDHPMYSKWRDHMAQYGAYNLGMQIAPGGSYFEFGAAYHMHGFARASNGLPALEASGAPNIAGLLKHYLAPDWRYYMNLLTPYDSRWRTRMIPGLANSQPGNTENFVEGAGGLAGQDPELASNLLWAWTANGESGGWNPALKPAALAPKEPALTSQVYPGMGVIFRAHQGPQETYMLFRSGFQWSHWTVDPGHFILMSKGAVLVPYQPFQYGGPSDPTIDLQNTIRFGHSENIWPHGWGDSNILDHAFGASVDYAWGLTGFPEWFIKPGISPSWQAAQNVTDIGTRKLDPAMQQTEGAVDWSRQILFMKGKTATSPNYFVIRDSVSGDAKLATWLYLNLLGTKKDIRPQGETIHVDTEWPTKLDVRFAQPEIKSLAMHEQRLPLALHNSNIGERVGAPGTISPNWVKPDGSPWEGKPRANQTHENHVILRVPSAPGSGYFWVLYPREANEPEPQVNVLADGVMKITHREGTDYVFLGASPVAYEGEGVVFRGRAGAVRLDPASVVLVKGGGEGQVGYKGRIVTGAGVFEKRFALAQLATGAENIPAPEGVIELPAVAVTEQKLTEGVMRGDLGNGVIRYRSQGPGETIFKDNAVRIEGGASVVEISADRVRFVAAPGYVKLSAGNRAVRGVGPFDLTFTDTGLTGKVEGETRSLVVSWPEGIVRPMFLMDGVRFFAGWPDDHSIGKGTSTPQFAIGFGVTAGQHSVSLGEWVYPELPSEPERRQID